MYDDDKEMKGVQLTIYSQWFNDFLKRKLISTKFNFAYYWAFLTLAQIKFQGLEKNLPLERQ